MNKEMSIKEEEIYLEEMMEKYYKKKKRALP